MKELILKRVYAKDYTIGILTLDGKEICNILERPKEDKIYKGCIPEGSYKLDYTYSPAFKKGLLLVCGVPGFTGIRIHGGNTIKDSRGCLLPCIGFKRDEQFGYDSQKALKLVEAIYEKFKSEGVSLKITH